MVATTYNNIYERATNARISGVLELTSSKIAHTAAKGDQKVTSAALSDIESIYYRPCANGYELRIILKDENFLKFEGFKDIEDITNVCAFLKQNCNVDAEEIETTASGYNWGDFEIKGNFVTFNCDGSNVFDFPVGRVKQAQIQKKQDITLFFKDEEDPTMECLSEIRFIYPKSNTETVEVVETPEGEEPVEQLTIGEKFHQNIYSRTGDGQKDSHFIVAFPEVNFVTPRGRHEFLLYKDYMRLRGKSDDHIVEYSNILKYFLLPREQNSIYFVICLQAPLRKGQSSYFYLIMQIPTGDKMEAKLNITEEDLPQYENLQPTMEGDTYEVMTKVVKTLSKKKVLTPFTGFVNADQYPLVKCSHKTSTGSLFPLKQGLIFLSPVIYIKDSEISKVIFKRVGSLGGEMRILKKDREEVEFRISQVKDHFNLMYEHMKEKTAFKTELEQENKSINYNEDDDDNEGFMALLKDADGSDESDDEDYHGKSSEDDDEPSEIESSGEGSSSSEAGDDDNGDDDDSDDDEGNKKKKSKKPVKRPAEKSDGKKRKRAKKEVDPNAPKKPVSAYLLHNKAMRPTIDDSQLKAKEVMTKLAEMWSKCDKKIYEDQRKELMVKYEEEYAEYIKNNPNAGKKAKSPKSTPKKSGSSLKQQTLTSKSQSKSPAKTYKSADTIEDSDDDDDDDDDEGKDD